MNYGLSIKAYSLTLLLVVDFTLVINKITIDKCLSHLILKLFADHWRPTTLVKQIFLFDCVRIIRRNDHKVGIVSLSDETTLLNLENLSRIMAHLLHNLDRKSVV